jgi:hypothetical protein
MPAGAAVLLVASTGMETNNLPAFAAAPHRAQSVAITRCFVLCSLFGVSGGIASRPPFAPDCDALTPHTAPLGQHQRKTQ